LHYTLKKTNKMPDDKKTRAQKAQQRKRKRNLRKANRYERTAERKTRRASSLTSKGHKTPRKKQVKAMELQQEAQGFRKQAKKTRKKQGAYDIKKRSDINMSGFKPAEGAVYGYSQGGRGKKPKGKQNLKKRGYR